MGDLILYIQDLVWKTLVTINNILVVSSAAQARQLLVEESLLHYILKLSCSESKKIRLQVWWIVGNAGLDVKQLTSEVVPMLVKVMYTNSFQLYLLYLAIL